MSYKYVAYYSKYHPEFERLSKHVYENCKHVHENLQQVHGKSIWKNSLISQIKGVNFQEGFLDHNHSVHNSLLQTFEDTNLCVNEHVWVYRNSTAKDGQIDLDQFKVCQSTSADKKYCEKYLKTDKDGSLLFTFYVHLGIPLLPTLSATKINTPKEAEVLIPPVKKIIREYIWFLLMVVMI